MNKSEKHKGHRQRLKSKVKNYGLRALSDHEIIELILTYTIPLRDTNELAHDLLDKYGSINAILDANRDELITNKGVGEETALLFSVLNQLFEIVKNEKSKHKSANINSTQAVISYFRENFDIKNYEQLYVLCASKTGKLTSYFCLRGENDCQITIDTKTFVSTLNANNPSMIVMIHTHPNGEVVPSAEDIRATARMYQICQVLGIRVVDHIILNESNHFSFGASGIMNKIVVGSYSELLTNEKIAMGAIEKKTKSCNIFDNIKLEDIDKFK